MDEKTHFLRTEVYFKGSVNNFISEQIKLGDFLSMLHSTIILNSVKIPMINTFMTKMAINVSHTICELAMHFDQSQTNKSQNNKINLQ